MAEMTKVQYDSFPQQFIREAFMGCYDESDLPRLIKHHAENVKSDPHAVWIKVLERRTGRIIAGSQWKIFPNCEPVSNEDKPPPWLEGEARDKSAAMMRKINEKRRAANPYGYVRKCRLEFGDGLLNCIGGY